MSMRGQISLEAIMVIGIAVIVLTSFFNINMERYRMAEEIGEAGEAKMAGELLATAINAGYANGEGFNLYLSSAQLNFTRLGAMGVDLPIEIDANASTINIKKSTTISGVAEWNLSVGIIPSNLLQEDPTSQYPEVTIFNNGTNVIIYADDDNIEVE
jgi:hypothetical protein